MPTNSQNTYPITGNTVPADRLCIKNLQDVVNGVQDFCSVQGLGGNSGSSFPTQDTIGQQAFQLAQQLQLQVAALQGQVLTFRASPSYQPVPAGTNEIAISWTIPMPNTNYQVLLGFIGKSASALSASFSWWVVAGSQTTTGCTIHFDSAPALTSQWQYTWFVLLPPVASASTTVISGFTPTTGSISGATSVTLFGVGFTGTQSVTFNGTAATFTVVSDTQITTTVPAGSTTGSIGVTTGNGTTYSAQSFTVTA